MASSIKIMYYNARSLCAKSKVDESFNFIMDNNVDIALFSETWLKAGISFYHSNYTTYRFDRSDGRIGGGVAICIKKNISHELLPSLNLEIIEAIGIKVHTSTGDITIYSVYYPGTSYSEAAFNSFHSDLRSLTNRTTSFFICGDLNAKHNHWNCVRNNRVGNIVYNEMNFSNYIVENPPTPTYFSYQANPTTLDIVLTNNLHNMTQPIAHQDLSSDHLPVTFEICITEPIVKDETQIFRYDKANWKHFKDFIGQNINLNKESEFCKFIDKASIDKAIQSLSDLILLARDRSIPKSVQRKADMNIEFSDNVKLLIRLRNTRRRQWQRTRSTELRQIVKDLNEEIQHEIQLLRNERWNTFLENIDSVDSKKLWSISKILRKKSKGIPTLRCQNANGPIHSSYIITDEDKAEALANHFESVYDNRAATADLPTINTVEETIRSLEMEVDTSNILRTSPSEISSIIKGLRNSKSPGFDEINNKLLKQLPKKALIALNHIFNACMRFSYFPVAWKNAKVIAIQKPGKDPFNSSSYRPISLLSSLAKIFERILLSRINLHIYDENIIPNQQFGFRKFHSCNHQLARVASNIRLNIEMKKSTGLVLLDIEKAFDCVWHDALIFKMKILNFPTHLIKIIQSFLSGRTFSVCVNDSTSAQKKIPAGVPQGAVLSPTLYNIFTSDLPASIETNNCNIALFADDTALYSSSESPIDIIESLEEILQKTSEYFKKWNIKTNTDKSEAIFITLKRASRNLPQRKLIFENNEIQWQDKVKYLGLVFDKKCNYSLHVDHAINRANVAFRMLYPLLNRKSKLCIRHKKIIYTGVIRPILTYGCPVWSSCANSHKNKLQIIQNKNLKVIYNLPRRHHTDELHDTAEISLISNFMNKLKESFLKAIPHSKNPLINELMLN